MMAAQLFSGASFGILLGILLGLSTSPVVSLVVGALATLMPHVIALRASPAGAADPASPASGRVDAYKMGMFALCCVVGIIAGIYLRTHDALSPPAGFLRKEVAALMEIGVTRSDAEKLVLSRYRQTPLAVAPAEKPDAARLTVLMASTQERCDKLGDQQFASARIAAAAFKAGEEPQLQKLSELVSAQAFSEPDKLAIIQAGVEVLCAKS